MATRAGPFRQSPELLLDESGGTPDLELADERSGEDVAGAAGGDRDVGEAVDAGGEVVANIPVDAAGSRRRPDQGQRFGDWPRDLSRVLEPRLDRQRVPQEVRRADDIHQGGLAAGDQLLGPGRIDVEGHAARDGPVHGRTGCRRVGRLRSGSRLGAARSMRRSAGSRRRPPRPRYPPCDLPDVPARARRRAATARAMTAGLRPAPRAPGNMRLRAPPRYHRPPAPSGGSCCLSGPPTRARSDSAMLIAQGDLQVEDMLAVTLEAEVPRLDHAGVNRPDRDLVDLVAFDAEEIGAGRVGRRARSTRRPSATRRRVPGDRTDGTGLA